MVGFGLDYACAHIIIPANVNLLPIQADSVTERDKLSIHNCSKVLGVLLESCDDRTPNTPRARALLVCRFFAIGGSWWFRGVFCACFVLFERSVKLRETGIEQESLLAVYSF